jgi:hypothetical protein
MWKGWWYKYVRTSCIPVRSDIMSHTHTQISRRQYLIPRRHFYTRPTLPHTLTLQRLCHAMAHTHHIWRCQGSVYVTWTQLRTDTKNDGYEQDRMTHPPYLTLSRNSLCHLHSTKPSTIKVTSLFALSVWTIHYESWTQLRTDTKNDGYEQGRMTSKH